MDWLLSLYIGTTIIGVGVTLFDLFGLLGSHEGGQDSIGHDSGPADQGDGFADQADGFADQADGFADQADGFADHADDLGQSGSVVGQDRPRDIRSNRDRISAGTNGVDAEGARPLLAILSVARNVIYFCLGFGPVGWFALATTGDPWRSLAWSLPVGGVALMGTRALRRFMRHELNSEIKSSELLMERGDVIVSIGAGELGRVRIRLGDLYVERFARAVDQALTIRVGTHVRVTDVNDECVYVEPD